MFSVNSHLKGLLIAFFGIVILTPDAVLVRLADSNSWTVLFWRGIFFAAGIIAIVSLIMLKEKPALYTWLSMIIVFIGIYIVMAGDKSGMNLMGNLFALTSVILGGFSFTLLRKYKNVNMVPAMAVNGVAIALIGFVFADSLVLSSQSMLYILASGIVLAVSFSLITIAPQYIPAPEVAMFFPLGTVLGTLLAWLVIKEQPSSNALIGGSIVIVTLFCHAWYSNKLAQNLK